MAPNGQFKREIIAHDFDESIDFKQNSGQWTSSNSASPSSSITGSGSGSGSSGLEASLETKSGLD